MYRDVLEFHERQEIRDIVIRHVVCRLDYGPERILVLYIRSQLCHSRDELLLVARLKHAFNQVLALGADRFSVS